MRNVLLWSIGVLLLSFISCNSQHYNYKVDQYHLTLEPLSNNKDVKATIEITYSVDASTPKSDGFKFVGTNTVDSLICWDENGTIPSQVEYLRETRISYQFNPVVSATKKIKATFILRDFIQIKDNRYVIDAPWAGVFRVPVLSAKYSIIFPSGIEKIKWKEPVSWEEEFHGNSSSYSFSQSPLREKTIKVKFER